MLSEKAIRRKARGGKRKTQSAKRKANEERCRERGAGSKEQGEKTEVLWQKFLRSLRSL